MKDKSIKAYFSFILVIAYLFLLLSFLLFTSYSFKTRSLELKKLFYKSIDLSKSIEESAKSGAYLGVITYLSLNPKPELEELNKAGKLGALAFVELLERNKRDEYAIFCISSPFSKSELEGDMIKNRVLMIPREAKHFSISNCYDSIDVEVSSPLNIKVFLSNEEQLIGFSYYSEETANVELLNPRVFSINQIEEDLETPLEEYEDLILETLDHFNLTD